ncbi:glycoside hydrolase family 88 protein [Opitutus sp. ER46]|uniref:glycoside hydrolase family 88/105 protein n=1 Tax=Opitutus sp. ER46 TaxID=2161864 RepID=UPI000D31E5C5|nr:glycoside hydrolase family 88 protein [Opitutus sp. ER46]PTX94292.1 family 88 glycosyl hydrolase [Opitutus sp. ER46]
MKLVSPLLLLGVAVVGTAAAQPAASVAPTVPALRRFEPAYPVRYAPMPVPEIRQVMERVHGYLDGVTPAQLIDAKTRQPVDLAAANPNAVIAPGDFLLVTYEWGVTYAGMLLASEVTADGRYADYAATRLKFIADAAPRFRAQLAALPENARERMRVPFRSVNAPHTLDDSGAMAAAFIKAARAGHHPEAFRPVIDNYLKWISRGQQRLADGTLARNRPLPNSLWLDDLYMSVPALAQMGALTGDRAYFDDAARQLIQFHRRMFVPEKGLFMHGWVEAMDPHPAFHWGRANGWAVMAAVELLSVMPDDHPQHAAVLAIFRAHARGLAACQGGDGLWHQLLDRPDSYPESSASAMFVYALARGINRGWLQPLVYGPCVSLGWNAVAKTVNVKGQVEQTCVGTGMGFEPTFYYYRPTSVYAAHGYGPVLLAGAEMITLLQGQGADANVHDGAIQFSRAAAWR